MSNKLLLRRRARKKNRGGAQQAPGWTGGALLLALALGGCASSVSLDEPANAGSGLKPTVYYASTNRASAPDYHPSLDDQPVSVALVFPVQDMGITGANWNPEADQGSSSALWGGQRLGRQDNATKSNYEFEQKLDDTWVVKQTLRYGQPGIGQSVDWSSMRLQGQGDDLYPGLGTFNVGTQALAKFHTVGLQHNFKFGFDYLKTRDIYESRVGLAPSLDIFDPIYGTTLGAQRSVARAYMEQRQLGMYVQDQVTLDKWTVSLVGRRDQLTNRTIDLGAADQGVILQDDQTFSGRVGLKYQFASGFAPYMNYSNTYAPVGGADYIATSSQQYETGVKFQPPTAWGKMMTVSAFNQIQNNAQVTDPPAGCDAVGCQSWAELRVRGASVESKLQPVEGLKVVAAYLVTNSSVIGTSPDAYGTMLANRFPTVTEQQVSVRARYAVDRGSFAGLSLDGRVGRTGASYGYGGATELAPSYVLVDAGVSYDFGRVNADLKGLQFRASASNLLDRGYVAYCYTDACSAGVGRSVSATVNYQVQWR